MQEIPFGKRPKNPLRKRVWKDMLRDWKRYLMIFTMLVITIGFVSGMYVANNSMMHTLDENVTALKQESGHFELSKKADDALLSAIETGDMADMVTVFRDRAYEEAEPEVTQAVKEALTEEVEKQVKDAISQQVEQAVNAQFAPLEASGASVPPEEKQKALDTALETAMKENYDSALEEALKTAFDSDEYQDALSDAMDEAKKEINQEIDDQYAELADRYNLEDENFQPVPVTVYELFCKENEEFLSSEKIGKIRVYQERTDIDLYDILDGRKPQNDHEILIDRMHADNAGIHVGDTLKVGSIEFEVCGLAAFVDYSTLYEKNTDTMFDALTFNVAMTTNEGFARLKGITHYDYAFLYQNPPADTYQEKELSDNFLKALITQTAVSENETEIKDFIPAYANHAMTFAEEDMGSDKAMGGALLYILTAVLAFIFAVTISTTLEKEASVIGTLRASGYTKGELLRYYMSAPCIIVVLAAIIGNILGYTVMKQIVVSMYYNSYSLPNYETLWTPDAFLRTTILPAVMMILINLIVIIKTLKLTPLQFLRHELKKTKRTKAVRLPRWKFFKRFRMRVFLQNLPNYLMLFTGICFVMLLLSMAVGMPTTLSYYQEEITNMLFAQEQVILSSAKDEDDHTITTSTDGAEKFSITSLERKSDSNNEEISVYGVLPDSQYIHLSQNFSDSSDQNEVYISKAFAEKFNIHQGDMITLSEKYEHKDYTWKVYDIYDYSAGIAVFMTNQKFNQIFEKDADEFSGYMADNPITDIDEDYIAKKITAEDMTKLTRQLDHSMGAYMLYFQYVCVIVAAIILYLLTKIIIEKNERPISMVKILGYTNAEASSLYLVTTGIVVFFSEFLAIYIGYEIMGIFWKNIMMSLGGWFSFKMTTEGFLKEFILVFIAYLIITIVDFVRIRNIPKVLALKNAE